MGPSIKDVITLEGKRTFEGKGLEDTANFYPMKTMGAGNCGVPAGKTCTIYVVDKPWNIYRLPGNAMLIIGFHRNLEILQGFPTTGKPCKDSVMPCKHLQCVLCCFTFRITQ